MTWFGRRPRIDAENVIGNFVGGDVHGTLIQQFNQGAPPNEPSLPWRELPRQFDPFRFLSWRARLAPLVGRGVSLTSLEHWAESGDSVKVRFLTGGGGTGKSRLAAELATRLRAKQWSAGFVALDKPAILPVPKEGLLWIVDYPEENRTAARGFLSALAELEEPPATIRLLLLSRRSVDWWQSDIDAAHAADICDTQATQIAGLTEDETVELYRLSYDRTVEHLGLKGWSDIDDRAIRSWRAKQPELHGLPLFAMAAAIHSAVEGNAFPNLEGGAIVQALVRRERYRMDNLGRNAGFGEAGLSRLIGLAAIPGTLLPDDVRDFAAAELEMGIPAAERIVDRLRGVPWWDSHSLPGLTPDVLAAELLLQILSDRPDRAGAWLFCAIERSTAQWVSRIERLAYDMKRVRGPKENRISGWLAEIVDLPERPLDVLQPVLLEQAHRATLELAVRVAKRLSKVEGDEHARARWLHNAALILARAGDTQGALAMIQQAVDINRTLAADGRSESLLHLASSLNNLSNRLSEDGRRQEAVTASREAIGIRSKALAEDPASDEKALDLASALNNYSAHLAGIGENSESVECIKYAVELYRQIAKIGRRNVEPELATALRNLAQSLPPEALTSKLDAIEEAIRIVERLAVENPVRFEPELANFLKTLSSLKDKVGDEAGAQEAAEESLRVLERLAIEEPGRFDADLAISYENLSLRLGKRRRPSAAVDAIERAVAIWRPLAEQNPGRFLPDLARSLDHLSAHTREELVKTAMTANEEAVSIWRQVAAEHTQRFEPDLVRSLNNLSNLRSVTGDPEGGYAAAKEAHEVVRRLASQDPARFNHELAVTLMTLHNRLLEMETGWPSAVTAISEAVDILRKLAAANPRAFDRDLVKALMQFGKLLDATGDARGEAVLQEAGDTIKRMRARTKGAGA